VIDLLLPDGAVGCEAFGDTDDAPYPGEEDLIAAAVPGRRREFVTARRCARQALGALGHPPAPIRTGPSREPLWPAGVVGSITHCAGYRAAAVAHRTGLAGLGLDAEPNTPLPDGVLKSIARPEEQDRLVGAPGISWGKVLFSAKEAVYKAWFPLTGRWLGFEDASLTFGPGTFRAAILIDGTRTDGGPPLTTVSGRFLVEDGLVLAVAVIPE